MFRDWSATSAKASTGTLDLKQSQSKDCLSVSATLINLQQDLQGNKPKLSHMHGGACWKTSCQITCKWLKASKTRQWWETTQPHLSERRHPWRIAKLWLELRQPGHNIPWVAGFHTFPEASCEALDLWPAKLLMESSWPPAKNFVQVFNRWHRMFETPWCVSINPLQPKKESAWE